MPEGNAATGSATRRRDGREEGLATIRRLAEFGVATVYEASGRAGLVDIPLLQTLPFSRAAGPARVALCGQSDNRAVHEVIAHAEPGDVLVLTMPTPAPVALFGELLATQALHRGVAGVLVDGAIRDIDVLRHLPLPVWTRFVRVAGASKAARGAIDVPVEVGGATIRPRDVLLMDADGAVVVPVERLEEVIAAAGERVERERGMKARLEVGELSYDIYGMRGQDTPPAEG